MIFDNYISFVAIFVLIAIKVESIPNIIRVGGLFTVEQPEQELAFRFAIDKINTDGILPTTTVVAQVERVDSGDSFMAQEKVCGLLRNGVVAIFGPQDSISSMQVRSICENFEIPHIETRFDNERDRTDLSINFYPHPSQMSKVYMDLIKAWNWESFAIIYDSNDGIVHFKEFFDRSLNETWNIKLFQLRKNIPYRDIFWEVKRTNEKNIILDVHKDNLLEVLNQAQQVGLLTENHNYLITSLDLLSLDLENYRHSRTNLTSLRIIDENSMDFKTLVNEWHIYAQRLGRRDFMSPPQHFSADSLLIYDAVKVLIIALKELYTFDVSPISCEQEDPWLHGSSVINYIRQVQTDGSTHFIKFDDTSLRSSYVFEVISINDEGFEVCGNWSMGKIQKNQNWHKHYSKSKTEYELIRITTALNDPFTMNAKRKEELKGNDQFEGFVVDLVQELAKELNFKFEIHIVRDKQYGSSNPNTGEWNGMIGEVINGEADIAVADLAVNSERELVVDFTYPFMSTGISILYKKPLKKETSLWSFLSPFSVTVWIYMLGTFVGVSVLLFLTGRFSPYEWGNPHPCRQDDKVLENVLNIRNSFWCTIGSLMQQGSDIAPKAMSTRVIIAIWYFFTLIIVSSYTANLAAFLTVESIPFPFNNVEELVNTTNIKYGCSPNGATHKFFKNSNISTYQRVAEFMQKRPEVFKQSKDGREEVERAEGKYAYFMEAAPIEYIIERYCNLTQVGGLLDNKGYGIATRKGSKLRTPLSQAILKLQEMGVLQQLKDRWWKQKGGGQCISKPSSSLTELGLKNLGGVFLVLLGGSIVAILMAICEFIYKIRKENKQTNFVTELFEDLKFAMTCHESSKPTRSKSKSEKSLTASRSFSGSKTGSTPRLESQFSTHSYY